MAPRVLPRWTHRPTHSGSPSPGGTPGSAILRGSSSPGSIAVDGPWERLREASATLRTKTKCGVCGTTNADRGPTNATNAGGTQLCKVLVAHSCRGDPGALALFGKVGLLCFASRGGLGPHTHTTPWQLAATEKACKSVVTLHDRISLLPTTSTTMKAVAQSWGASPARCQHVSFPVPRWCCIMCGHLTEFCAASWLTLSYFFGVLGPKSRHPTLNTPRFAPSPHPLMVSVSGAGETRGL